MEGCPRTRITSAFTATVSEPPSGRAMSGTEQRNVDILRGRFLEIYAEGTDAERLYMVRGTSSEWAPRSELNLIMYMNSASFEGYHRVILLLGWLHVDDIKAICIGDTEANIFFSSQERLRLLPDKLI